MKFLNFSVDLLNIIIIIIIIIIMNYFSSCEKTVRDI